jgi:hypothetical protein
MDWRSYIPHALGGGFLTGLVLAAIFIPIQLRRERRRSRDSIQAIEAILKSKGRIEGPKGNFVPKRRWQLLRRPFKGYYGSGD